MPEAFAFLVHSTQHLLLVSTVLTEDAAPHKGAGSQWSSWPRDDASTFTSLDTSLAMVRS